MPTSLSGGKMNKNKSYVKQIFYWDEPTNHSGEIMFSGKRLFEKFNNVKVLISVQVVDDVCTYYSF